MPYTLIQKISNQHCHITFKSQFKGETVTWDTHFFTLMGYKEEQNIHDSNLKQFIDIYPINPNNMKLTVVLNIKEINVPNIQKMMIMIKQYKNLSIGRHEYG